MKKIILMVIAMGLFPLAALADDSSDGCGLGWQVTNKKSFLATTTRGTTNAVVPPTFGMSSGTIGCEQHSFAKKDVPAVKFVAGNYDSLVIEMAQGQGEYLQGLARTLGCDDSASTNFGKMTQDHYQNIVGKSPLEMFLNVKKQLKMDKYLAGRCNAA